MDPSLLQLALLTLTATGAGVVDAIAGGGGLVTVPALLAVGLPPHLALGTNKGQSVFGSFAALVRYQRAGLLDAKRAAYAFPLGFAGALGGGFALLHMSPEALRPLVLILLVAVAAFLVFYRRPEGPVRVLPPRKAVLFAGGMALAVGAYDGFFGPGTGTFLIAGYVGLLGLSLPRATADAKVINFASNLASVSLFWWSGVLLWKIALPMAAGQALGGFIGAHLAVKGGAKLIRVVVLVVVAALVAKISYDLYAG